MILTFYPLILAMILLGGAFIIEMYAVRLSQPLIRRFNLGLIGFALATMISYIIITKIILPVDVMSVILSNWGLETVLAIQVDPSATLFFLIPLLLLTAIFIIEPSINQTTLLAIAGAAILVFASANEFTLAHTVFFFDVIGCLYWLRKTESTLAFWRFFLGVFTAGVLALVGLFDDVVILNNMLAFMLWLRLGLYPLVETTYLSRQETIEADDLAWILISTVVSINLALAVIVSLPQIVLILTIAVMLLNAWLAWLGQTNIRLRLLRMILIQPSMALLVVSISPQVAIIIGLIYPFALSALWFTPLLPHTNPYTWKGKGWGIVPFLASLALLDFPFTLGWVAFHQTYADLLLQNQPMIITIILIAKSLALSVLYHYWLDLLNGKQEPTKMVGVAAVLIIPFLIPGLANVIFTFITGQTINMIPNVDVFAFNGTPYFTVFLVGILAFSFGYGRDLILNQSQIRPELVKPILNLNWFLPHAQASADVGSRLVLRLKAILEGTNYLSWVILIVLVRVFIVFLN